MIKIQLDATKGFKIIIIYWPSITNLSYAITFNIVQNTTKRKENVFFKKNHLYVLSNDWWISGLTPEHLREVRTHVNGATRENVVKSQRS